jgi:hypothetical protein
METDTPVLSKKVSKKETDSPKTTKEKAKEPKKDLSKSYNQFKQFHGREYTGMKIGRSHKWNYDQGEWKETKVTPDLWEISYAVTKRRAGHAPEGSGVPVGTEYHWFILAHQDVKKLNANDYSTAMTGIKYKLAFKRAGKEKWNATPKTERNRLIKLLQDYISQLEKDPVPLDFEYKGKQYTGEGIPTPQVCNEYHCFELGISLNEENLGIIHCTDHGWKMKNIKDEKFVDAIGQAIASWYDEHPE